ncbi:aminodeoxychorismate lyase [Rossellomorea marisflavi]|uniref:aminodeoxychorismate lyase n=1 Tax=Rossellomorea marisflavi TaxID=189381 RepID=UPI0009A5F272|nr:aminodeoxychorismate lyase [Rossellomorea marisflavi]WJV18854.1 aminodeoxychorismate lyase [Rossellomorea marisflavi]
MYIYLNGQIIHRDEARISPFDHGFLYGMGLFETFRTYGGHPFLIGDHLDRLSSSLQDMKIHCSLPESKVMGIVKDLLERNGWEDAYCRLNISGGPGEIGLPSAPYEDPTIILFQKPLPDKGAASKEGVFLSLARNTPETGERLKSHHYLNNLAGKREVGPSPVKEGIFLTDEGWICEGVTSNLFWTKDDDLYTPAVGTGLLNGITRRFIIALAGKAGLRVREGYYKKEDLLEADEIFFTNSVQEVVPVHQVEETLYPGAEGRWTVHLQREYGACTSTLTRISELS